MRPQQTLGSSVRTSSSSIKYVHALFMVFMVEYG
jgi:hypothetical protein